MTRSWALLLLLPAVAFGQQQPAATTSATDRARPQTLNEVERGFYIGVHAGPFFVVNPPAPQGAVRPFAPGQMAQVEAGLDIGDRLSLGVFITGTANRPGGQYTGNSGGAASGDYSALIPGGSLRVHLVGFPDSQEVNRLFIYARGGAGYTLFFPSQLLPDPDIWVFAGGGVEYYTRLRHFSVGLEATGVFLVTSGSFGFAITPQLRYAF